jgi:hypothetical protein
MLRGRARNHDRSRSQTRRQLFLPSHDAIVYCLRERERFSELPLPPRLLFGRALPVDIPFNSFARCAFCGARRLACVLRPAPTGERRRLAGVCELCAELRRLSFFERRRCLEPSLSPRAAFCRYERVAFSTERELLALRFEDCPRALAARLGLIERRALRLVFCSCIVPRANGMR